MTDMSDDLKALNQTRYAATAQKYVDSQIHASGMWLQDLVKLTNPQPDWHVLDVATGGGHTALAFAPHVAQVTATDFTPPMLAVARRFITAQGRANVRYAVADAERLPVAAHSLDCVTCRVAAHHFPDIFAFVRQAYRTLKPGGVLVIHDHVMPNDAAAARYVNAYEKLRDPAHARALTEYEWRGIVLDAGFTIPHIEQRTMQHQLYPWAQRQNCDDDTIERLQVMLLRAPQKVAAWLQPQHAGTASATHTDHHIIIIGQKPNG